MDLALLFVAFGALFLTGLLADALGRRTRLPRVTLLLICGILVGESGFDLLPSALKDWYEAFSVLALTMIAFLLGSSLNRETLVHSGRTILSLSIIMVFATLLIVAFGLWLVGVPPEAALVLGAIATATDPAATQDALRQSKASGPFVDNLRAVVAIDDAWGIIVFSLAVVLAQSLNGVIDLAHFGNAAYELGGAILLGLLLGVPAAFLSGRLKPGEPLQSEALGIVFLTAGLALWVEVSFLLAGMTAGMVIANFARHHDRAFHEIEHIQWPFMVLFFLLAGATFQGGLLWAVGMVGMTYVGLRVMSRIVGGWIGGWVCGVPQGSRIWYGMAMLPQAGVAIGMALVASQLFPESAELILTVTIGTTVFFEIIGPILTMISVRRVQPQRR